MNLQESIRRILREERNLSKLIVKLLNRMIVSRYEDVCKVEVVQSSVDSDYTYYKVIIYFIGGYGTRNWPRTMRVRDKEENILNEAWEYVHDTFGFSTALQSVHIPSCDE